MNTHTLISLFFFALIMVGVALTIESRSVQGQDSPEIVRTDANGDVVEESDLASARLDRELLEEIVLVSSITIDDTFFSDPMFLVLRDFGRPLPNYPVGRSDPFQLPGVGSVSGTNATSTR